ncbi:hypothetical protein ACOMHN_049588 [Nucella lapillus]
MAQREAPVRDPNPTRPRRVTSPVTWRSHEVEDLRQMSRVIFSESTNPEKWGESSLFEAVYLIKQLGTKLPRSFQDLRHERGLMTLRGRRVTYPEDWIGFSPLDMALTGLYVTEGGKVKCCGCDIDFRGLKTQSVNYLQRHKDLAPFCALLKRGHCHGPLPTPEGKRIRHNSASAMEELEINVNDDD